MTPKQLLACTARWQQRLRIQDWDINLKLVSLRTMQDETGNDNLGACSPYDNKKKADVWICKEEDLPADCNDQEYILVHELLHVVMPPRDFNLPNDHNHPTFKHYERLVDQLALALVEAYRG